MNSQTDNKIDAKGRNLREILESKLLATLAYTKYEEPVYEKPFGL